MNRQFRYSVIIPYKGRLVLLNKAVASIPDREDIQIIVINNSYDPIEDVCVLQKGKATVLLLQYPFGGPGGARNHGLEKAEGVFIVFCDADDRFTPQAFSVFDRYCSEKSDLFFFKMDSVCLANGSRGHRHIDYNKKIDLYLNSGIEKALRYNWGSACGKMYKASLLRNHKILFSPGAGGDVPFSTKAGYYASSITVSKECVYQISEGSHGEESLTQNLSVQDKYNKYLMYLEKYRFLKEKGIVSSRSLLYRWALKSLPSYFWMMRVKPFLQAAKHKCDKLFFEVQLCDHCNLNCASCSHFSPLAPRKDTDIKVLEKDYNRLAELFPQKAFKRIRLLGGEPLMHPEVETGILLTRKFFPLARIELVTNGLLLHRMTESFWDACKQTGLLMVVSPYPINLNYDSITRLLQEKGIKFRFEQMAHSFNKDEMNENGEESPFKNWCFCKLAVRCSQLRNGRLYMCCKPAYADYLNRSFGTKFIVTGKDYVDLYSPSARKDIRKYLKRPIPFCRYCDILHPQTVDWHRSEKKKEEWL